jgi:hypothetical protein
MTNILGFAGAKQSGKTTCATFLHGYQLRFNDVFSKFVMDEEGNLLVNAIQIDENGEEVDGLGMLDINRQDEEFLEYSSRNIWPYVRTFSFAEPLKSIAVQLFGVKEDQCFGSDDNKNTPINIKWEDLPTVTNNSGFMTSREFLQYFGTDICRRIKPDVWTSACIQRIVLSGTQLAVVPDVRFPNEVEAIQKAGGKVIRLTRKPFEDSHSSETSLDSEDVVFDHVIDNKDMDIHETNMALMSIMKEWKWLQTKS